MTESVGSSFGKWVNKTCETNKLFDVKSNACIESNQAKCGNIYFQKLHVNLSDVTNKIYFKIYDKYI